MELRPKVGHLSYTQFMRVRVPQLRSGLSNVAGNATAKTNALLKSADRRIEPGEKFYMAV